MDDLDLERELRHALAVTPSVEFVTRVRTRIAEAPPPSIWAGVLRPAVAIACAAVIAVAIGMWPDDARLKPSPTGFVPATADPKFSATNSASTTDANRTTEPRKMTPTIVAPAGRSINVDEPGNAHNVVTEPPLPEVIIAQDDIRALHEFVTGAHELRFVASFDITPAPIPWAVTETLDNRN